MSDDSNGKRKIRAAALVALLVTAIYLKDVIAAINKLCDVVSPAVFGGLLAMILNAPMRFFENKLLFPLKKRHFVAARTLSLLFSYLLAAGVAAFFFFTLLPRFIDGISDLTESLPLFIAHIFAFLEKILGSVKISGDIKSEITRSVLGAINSLANSLLGMTPDVLLLSQKLFKIGSDLFFALAFSGYVLFDKEGMKKGVAIITKRAFKKERAEKILRFLRLLSRSFDNFFSGQMIEALILGVLCFLGMLLLKIPYAAIVSGVVAITAIVPIFGAIVGTVPSACLIMLKSPPSAVVFLVFIIVMQLVEGNFIYPKVVGGKIELPAFFVLLALLVGGGLFGIFGILTGVPLFAALYGEVKARFFGDKGTETEKI